MKFKYDEKFEGSWKIYIYIKLVITLLENQGIRL